MWKYKDLIKTILCVLFILVLFMFYGKYSEYVNEVKEKKGFTYKDWQVLYEICNKKSWPKTKFILQTYWSEETDFKNFLLGIE